MKYPFANLIDKDNMQGLLDSFCNAVGIASAIIDLDGIVIVGSNWQRICTDFHRVNKETCNRCIESDTELANQLNETGKHAFYRCKNGLSDAAAPIILENEHVANFFVGQFFLDKPDITFFSEQAEKFDFDAVEYLRAVNEVPIIPEEKLSPILNYLSRFAQTLAAVGLKELQRRESELALRSSEEKYRTLVESANDAIFILDMKGKFLEVNRTTYERLGYSEEEILSMSVSELDPPEFAERVPERLEQVRKHGYAVFESAHIRKDGTVMPVEVNSRIIDYKGEKALLSVIRDITERKQADEELRKSEETLKKAQEIACLGSWEWDIANDKITWSDQIYKIFNMTPQDSVPGYEDLQKMIHPDDRVMHRETVGNALQGKGKHDFDYRIILPDGQEKVLHSKGEVVRDDDGKAIMMKGITQDITYFKQTEKEKLQLEAQLQQAQRLESLGVLAGGIAHDFNNILTAIIGNISIAKIDLDPDDSSFENLTAAEKASIQATKLTQQLLTFSKGGVPVFNITPIDRILTDAISFALHGSNVKCKCIIPEDLWPVKVDSGQISQVFQNLLINANQAMPKGGVINIETSNENVNAANILDLEEGKYVKIVIVDQGSGIPRAHIKKIFDPFFSTKPGGSGLGLATSYSVLIRHMGAITVDSMQDIGTTFQLYLPAAEKGPLIEETTADKVYTGSGRILIMDDQEDVRILLAKILKNAGYDVEVSSDGHEALRLYRQALEKQEPFAAVVLDLTIPGGMGGVETLERLREMTPDVKAIVSSGYADDPALANYKEYGFSGVVKKPYRSQVFSKVLHDVLKA